MHYKLPPLPALQAFEAAARYENFAAAADELNLSQSAVSHRVRALEHHLGYPLFERLPRGLKLTEAAKAYLPSVRRAFDDILSSTSGIFGTKAQSSLIVRAPISYNSLWLSRIIGDFSARHPNISLRLTSSIWAEQLAVGEADIELRLGYGQWPGYKSNYLFSDRLVPVMNTQTARKIGKSISAETLAKAPLIHVLGTDDYWARYFAINGIQRPFSPADIRVDSAVTAIELTRHSHHITLVQRSFAKAYCLDHDKSAHFVMFDEHAFTTKEALYLVLAETTERQKPEASLFQNWLMQYAEK